MSSTEYAYRIGQSLPSMVFNWADADGNPHDFSAGWTFVAKVAPSTSPATAGLTKTSGIVGAATFPNVTIDWVGTDFSGLTAAPDGTTYVVHLSAIRTSDGKVRNFNPKSPPRFTILPAVS